MASLDGHEGVAAKLIADPRVDVNAANKDGFTPLLIAALHGHRGLVEKLLADPLARAAAMALREADLAEQRAMSAAQLLLAEEDAKLSATVKISKSAKKKAAKKKRAVATTNIVAPIVQRKHSAEDVESIVGEHSTVTIARAPVFSGIDQIVFDIDHALDDVEAGPAFLLSRTPPVTINAAAAESVMHLTTMFSAADLDTKNGISDTCSSLFASGNSEAEGCDRFEERGRSVGDTCRGDNDGVTDVSSGNDEPTDLLCPLTLELFVDPVIVMTSGISYERSAITEHIKRATAAGHTPTDPQSGHPIGLDDLLPNRIARNLTEKIRVHGNLSTTRVAPGRDIVEPSVSRYTKSSSTLAPELERFLSALHVGEEQAARLRDICIAQEIMDIDTACLLDEKDWTDAGVKQLGLRRKLTHGLSQLKPKPVATELK